MLQDRGVDLSFDMVKKENFESDEREVKVAELRVKSEFGGDSSRLESLGSKVGGGRLKFYKGESTD